jgi:hypothetical protein
MSILPTGIVLSDQQIKDFIREVNTNAEKIIGESKFKIPDPELPGLGLVTKLWIRQAEKSFAAYLAPIIVVKEVINAADAVTKIPEKIKDAANFAENPVQELLDVTVNPLLENDFFIPMKLVTGVSPTINSPNLKSLVARSQAESLSSEFTTQNPFPYVQGATGSLPIPGEYTFKSNSSSNVVILVSTSDNTGKSTSTQLSTLIPGDEITISNGERSQTWIIKQIFQTAEYYSLSVVLKNKGSEELKSPLLEPIVYVKVTQNPETSGKKGLRALIAPNGVVLFPIRITLPQLFSLVNIEIPAGGLLSKVVLEIGNFQNVSGSSLIGKRIKNLEAKAGWNFQKEVIEPILKGEYPIIKFKPEDQKTEKDIAREDLISIAKLYDLLINDPAFFFTMIVTYLKVLLLPLQIVIGTLVSALKKVLSAPLTIFNFIVQLLTDPIKLLGDLIAEAILEEVRKYIQPALDAAKIDWKTEVLFVNEAGKEKGLGRLISDIIIGRFACAKILENPNIDPNPKGSKMFSTGLDGTGITGGTATSGPTPIEFVSYSYSFKYDGTAPKEGEVSFNSRDLEKVNTIKVSTFDLNVNSVIPELISLTPGSQISVPSGDKTWVYRVISLSPSPGPLTYFQYAVSVLYNPEIPPSPTNPVINSTNSSILSPQAVLSPESNNQNVRLNPGSPFLKCLVDNYLPVKVIAIWESVKGILGVIIGFAITIPSLIIAIIKSVLSGPGYSDIAGVSENASSFVLEKLASIESSKIPQNPSLRQQYFTQNSLDILSISNPDPNDQLAKGTKDFVGNLISEDGIDSILLTQAKKKFEEENGREENRSFDPNAISLAKEDGTRISLVEYARNLKVLLTFAQRFSTSRTLNSNDSFLVSYFDGSTNPNESVNPDGTINPPGSNNYRKVSLRLDRASLNRYRLTRGETLDNSNSNIIVFIRDNIYVANLALKSFFG